MSTYELSDFRRPIEHSMWPRGEENQRYLEAYASEFNILEKIEFNSEIIRAEQTENENWSLHISSGGQDKIVKFDYLVIASGKFSVPVLPDIAGVDEFTKAGGKFLHSSQLQMDRDFTDKSVVVLGNGLSGVDLCNYLIDNDVQTTLVARGGQDQQGADVVRKIKNLNSEKFNPLFDTKIAKLKAGAAELENGQEVKLDYLVAATGFTHDFSFFDQGVRESILDANEAIVLFRKILPIGIRNLAFIGFSSRLFSKVNAELGSKWLAGHIDEPFALPSDQEQRIEIQEAQEAQEAQEIIAQESFEAVNLYSADLKEKSQQLHTSPSNAFTNLLSRFLKR